MVGIARSDGVLGHASRWSLVLIFAAVSFPLLMVRRATVDSFEVDRLWLIGSFGVLAISGAASLLTGAGRKYRLDWRGWIVLAFAAVAVAGGIAVGEAGPMLNALLLAILCLSIAAASNLYHMRPAYRAASLVLIGFMALAYVIHGGPAGRWIGGIHPNWLGGAAFAAAFLGLAHRPLPRLAILGLSIWFAGVVSSRYALIGIALTAVVHAVATIRRLNGPTMLLGAGATAFAVIWLTVGGWDVITQALAVDDQARGVASGFTGRVALWRRFWPQFEDHWLLGYGFRNRSAYLGVHNGFLNLLLQTGLAGGLLMLVLVVGRSLTLLKRLLFDGTWETDRIYLAGLVGGLFGVFFQPQLINFGDPFGLAVLLALVSSRGPR